MCTASNRRWPVLALLAATLLAGLAAPQAQAATPRYIFTTFTSGNDKSMAVYTSTDATNFTLLKANAYTPPSGVVRDPSIMKYQGVFYVVYTNAEFTSTGTSFGLAKSTNLTDWTFVRDITVPVSGTRYTWAPEWFTDSDGSIHVIVSISTATSGFNLQAYDLTAKDPGTFASWSTPVHLTGMNSNYLDDFIVKLGSVYHDFTSNGTDQYIEQATATSLDGPYTYVGTGDWAGWGNGDEGPALLKLANGTWRIYFDGYRAGEFWYSDSTDGLKTFSAKQELPGLSGTVRHGTIIEG